MGNDTRERYAGPAWETLEAWVRGIEERFESRVLP